MQYPPSYHNGLIGSPFYRFYTYPTRLFPNRRIDPTAKHTVDTLFDATVCPYPDSWARYLLLIIWLWRVPDTAQLHYLECTINGLRSFRIDENLYLLSIHKHILSQRHNLKAQQFFSNLLHQSRHLLIIYLLKSCADLSRTWFSNSEQAGGISIYSVSHLEHLLSNFNFGYARTTVQAYARLRLDDKIKHARFKEEGKGSKKASGYARIRYSTRKTCHRALESLGIQKDLIQRYTLVVQSFKEIYTTKQEGKQSLPPPTKHQVHQICDRCNQRIDSLDLKEPFSFEEIQASLTTLIKALEKDAQLDRKPLSIDAVLGGEEGDNPRLDIPDPSSEYSVADALSIEDCRDYLAKLSDKTIEEFGKLPDDGKRLLRLHDGLGLVTKDIGLVIQKNQSTAYRQIQAHRGKVKKHCAAYCIRLIQEKYADVLNDTKSNDLVINHLIQQVDEYLSSYIQHERQDLVVSAIQCLTSGDRSQLLIEISTTDTSSTPDCSVAYSVFAKSFFDLARERWDVDLARYPELDDRLRQLMYRWLNNCAHFLTEEK